MDMTMIYCLIMVVGVVLLTYIVSKLRKSNVISTEDLNFVQHLFNISMLLIDELNLKNEDKILQISNVVLIALEYATAIASGTENVSEIAIKKCYDLCKELGIELTDNRKLILNQLIQLGLSNRYVTSDYGVFVLKSE